MSIVSAAKPTPLPPLRTIAGGFAASDIAGNIASKSLDISAEAAYERMRNYVNGGGRTFACLCTGTNVLSLTPNGHGDEDGVSPLLEGYRFGDAFLFWAQNTSTGAVTGTVVPKSGTLATLKVFKTNGAAQAGSGDVIANSLYVAWYIPILDGNVGGLVLK